MGVETHPLPIKRKRTVIAKLEEATKLLTEAKSLTEPSSGVREEIGFAIGSIENALDMLDA